MDLEHGEAIVEPGRANRQFSARDGAFQGRSSRAGILPCALGLVAVVACSGDAPLAESDGVDHCKNLKRAPSPRLSDALEPLRPRLEQETGVYVLDSGSGAMVTRAWLSEAAERSIDAQYFIFSADNVGKIATDYLLRAAERGVRVRILVDDLLVEAEELDLHALDAHPNVSIRVYNPNLNIGKSIGDALTNAATDFRGVNQRMHNKTFIVDGAAVITGGRNVADEYFDFDHEYNFRDRDVLLIGQAAGLVQASFDRFWGDELSMGVSELLEGEDAPDVAGASRALHSYACNPENFWPQVRKRIADLPATFDRIRAEGGLHWVRDVRFVSDAPGKNDGEEGLGGGGASTEVLAELIGKARTEIFIQTPYLVTTEVGRKLFRDAVARGVKVRILTNSLASTDNMEAFSGYQRDRELLLGTGVQIYEWRPDAELRKTMMRSALTEQIEHEPIFAIHAKSMVIDGELLVVGTFNLDPRSANLNTECVTIIPSGPAAQEVLGQLRKEIEPENAWRVTLADNPDTHGGIWKRMGLIWRRIIPRSVL